MNRGSPRALAVAKPEITTAIARPVRSGGTSDVAMVIAAAMNSPWTAADQHAGAQEERVAVHQHRRQVEHHERRRRGEEHGATVDRVVSRVSSGPPIISPSALAVTSAPADGTETASPTEIRSSIPKTSSSEVPIMNAPAKSTPSAAVVLAGALVGVIIESLRE